MGRRSDRDRPRSFAIARLLAGVLALVRVGSADAADVCAPRADDPSARVVAVDDRFDVHLDDGRTVRLAGLDGPPPSGAGPAVADAARQALVGGTGAFVVHLLSTVPDRWRRMPALLFRRDAKEPSVAIALLEGGLARAKPEPAVHPCFADFLAAEDRARSTKAGLWADPGTAVLAAGDADGLARASGGFVEVEGVLQVHASRGGTLYLTLGRDRWGFAAVLTRRDAARFAKDGLDVADYVGTPVRLRGDLDDRFGARIRLTDPDQLQSLEPDTLGTPPEPR